MKLPTYLWTLLALGVASLPCGAAGKLTPVPTNLFFTLAPGETRFLLISAVPVQITDVQVLALIDATTGMPLAVNSKDPQKKAVDIPPDYRDAPLRQNLSLTAVIDPHQFTIDGTHVDSGPSFSGTLVVFFVSGAGKPVDDEAIPFTVIRQGFSADKAESAALTPINTTTRAELVKGSGFQVCLSSDKFAYTLGAPDVPQLFDANGFPIAPGAIQLENPPCSIPALSRRCFKGTWSAEVPVQASKVAATVIVPYRADAPGAAWKQFAVPVEFVRPAKAVRIGDNNEVRFQIGRSNPFAESIEYRDPNLSTIYSTTPAGGVLRPDLPLRSELTTNDAQHVKDPVATLTSKVADGRIQFTAAIPRGQTSLRGNVYVEPPDVGDEVVLHPVFLVKDVWWLRLIAVVAAYLFAAALYIATTRVRGRILHNGTRRNLAARLSQFLSARPDLSNTDSVVLTRQLMADSVALDRAGETALADQNLQSASSRIDGLISAPPAATSPLAAGPEAIRLLQPANKQLAGYPLTLIVADPAVLRLSVVTWTITDSQTTIHTQSGPGRLSLQFSFPTAGTYEIDVTTPDPAAVKLSRILTVAPAPVPDRFGGLEAIDWLIQLAALVMACLAAYVATNSAEAWGNANDYVSLLAGAFGISAGTQSIRTVIGAVQGSR